ncbi:MAG: glutamate-1-semialdehyde 2,1-aminomutase [Myxococcales bacterium]|nr:glutamate-1-semialdehyde 2,1-aminomutase [Myxococcales bacterium]
MGHNLEKSTAAMSRAVTVIPGGVNSPVRAMKGVGGTPFFATSGSGAFITDIDGNRYVDYVLSYGPLILGHCDPDVVLAIQQAAARGLSYGAPTESEVELAELIRAALPSMEKVRLVNSGTEATMSAIRVARGFTGRDDIIKFTGCYHGHADHLLVKSGSGLATLGVPDSLGVPLDFARHTVTLPFNDLNAVESAFEQAAGKIAGVIVEPVVGNMGCVPPKPGFLEGLRSLCTKFGALLIFDEVMTGFRLGWGGAQILYNVTPDLTCLGKVIGGGLPIGAYGGNADIMEVVAPLGGVYQAGTLSGNPLSVAAGLATLKKLASGTAYLTLERQTAKLCTGLENAARDAGLSLTINRVGSMFTLFFSPDSVHDWSSADRCERAAFARFFHGMRAGLVNLPPSQFEACFTSVVHDDHVIEYTVDAARTAFQR